MQRELTSEFADPRRALPDELSAQIAIFEDGAFVIDMLDALPTMVMILNNYRQVVFANRATLDRLDLTRAEARQMLYGLRPGEVLNCLRVRENEAGCGTTRFCRTCGAVKAILAVLNGRDSMEECRIITESGEALDLLVTGHPLEKDGQQFVQFALQDISDVKRRQVLERIFFHDILNTAGLIQSMAETLPDLSEPDHGRLEGELLRLARRVVDEILAHQTLTHAESGELAITVRPVEAGDLLEEVREMFGLDAEARDIALLIEPDSQQAVFHSDQVLVRRVLINLVKNALEATLSGGQVRLSCTVRDSRVTLSVHNASVILPEEQLQVFQRSYSTKGPDRGIGTYGARLLTEQYLHGSVTFDSSPERGTTFYLTYPLHFPAG
jgi:signal transduction histidine kinase